jgi:hypothetical protein
MIAKLEQFVRRLAEDQAFREIAAQEPEKAVAMFGLIGPERQGALALCAQGGAASATTTADSFWI